MSQIRYLTLSPEQKDLHREQSKLRMQRYRERLKEKHERLTERTLTRKEKEEVNKMKAEQQKKWRLQKQDYRKRQKEKLMMKEKTTTSAEDAAEAGTLPYSRAQIRGAKFRLKKALPKDMGLRRVVLEEFISENDSAIASLKESGIISSPKTARKRKACEEVVNKIHDLEKKLRKKRNSESLAKRRLLVSLLMPEENEERANETEADTAAIEDQVADTSLDNSESDLEVDEVVEYRDWLKEIHADQDEESAAADAGKAHKYFNAEFAFENVKGRFQGRGQVKYLYLVHNAKYWVLGTYWYTFTWPCGTWRQNYLILGQVHQVLLSNKLSSSIKT